MEQKINDPKTELFESRPIFSAVLALVIPTVISQMVTVLYNMADTFFIGQTGDPNQVAAANICLSFFMLLSGFANLFGIGGASVISRFLGAHQPEDARRAAAFCIWTAAAVSLCYGIGVYSLRSSLLPFFGANEGTYTFCSQYIFWTVLLGSIPTVLNAELAHLVRAEGYSRQAGIGMTMGVVLNIILDPIFISVMNLQVMGAALATFLANSIAMTYFLVHILRRRGNSVISLSPRYYTLADSIPSEVLLTGLPSALMSLMSAFSNSTVNKLMASYCNEAVAGIGIAKKIDFLAFAIATGMSQGVVPLIGYNYASGNIPRMKQAIKTTFAFSLGVAVCCMILLFTCARPIVSAFIDDPVTVEYGQYFQRVICITGPCISVTMIVITIFQSTGKKFQPMVLSILRKGGLDVPFMFLMNALIGVKGIVWATPIGDFGAMIIALLVFRPFWKKLHLEDTHTMV